MEFIYENIRGDTIKIGSYSPYILTEYEGFDMADIEKNTSKGYGQDGVSIQAVNLVPRTPIITGRIQADSAFELEERKEGLLRALRQKEKGTLFCKQWNFERKIEGIVEKVKFTYQNSWIFQPFSIYLYCDDPYLTDIADSRIELTSWEGGLRFPFSVPFSLAHRGAPTAKVYNDGHEAVPVTILFKGPAVKPKIENATTGEFIAVNKALQDNETLYINTEYGKEYIEIERNGVRSNAYNYINLKSALDMTLAVGDNVLKYSSGRSDMTNAVEVRYKRRYLGI